MTGPGQHLARRCSLAVCRRRQLDKAGKGYEQHTCKYYRIQVGDHPPGWKERLMLSQRAAHNKGIVRAMQLALAWLLCTIPASSGVAAQQSLSEEYVLYIPAVAQHDPAFRVFLPIHAADAAGALC